MTCAIPAPSTTPSPAGTGAAHLAQLNAFESFPPFAAAVLIAQQVGASQAPIDGLALGFVGARLLYGICYLSDQPSLRSVAWQIGMLCIVGLFVVAAL
ncbi:MAG TPA: MAPEG family protein [Thermoanaerobaculia bacterium]|nr:MAPEG family protein [Thermoanaerobaculia bacterium]